MDSHEANDGKVLPKNAIEDADWVHDVMGTKKYKNKNEAKDMSRKTNHNKCEPINKK